MKKVVLVSVFCFVAFVTGYSQTKQESIKELFHLMQQDSLVHKILSSMVPSMLNQMQTDSGSSARPKEMMNSIMQIVEDIAKREINEDMVNIYDKYFSQNEINDLVSFYKSPSGHKFVKVTPDIQKDLMMVMMQKYGPEMQKSIRAKIDEWIKSEKRRRESNKPEKEL